MLRSNDEIIQRTFKRVAYVIRGYWEEADSKGQRRRVHTRLFDHLVPDAWVFVGISKNGGGHREHLVPCAWIRNQAMLMFDQGAEIDEVATMIRKTLRIARIAQSEAKKLNAVPGLKSGMPSNWDMNGDVFVRLSHADFLDAPIELVERKRCIADF